MVAQKLETARKEFAKAFITKRTNGYPPPPPPFFKHLSEIEIRESLDKSDLKTLKELKSHQKKLLQHNQKLLDMIDDSIKKLE